ncbi:MAG: VPLPA-CTERM sorting domain-containing protein [Gammaproteobacteria bacterium]|nr:VPLPA-CTERM sorting domain-containing protein [Gammaproteobacteria bacterium]
MDQSLQARFKALATVALFATGILSSFQISAGTIVPCGDANICSAGFTIKFNDNNNAGSGELVYDAKTGDIALNTDPTSINGGIVTGSGGIMWTMPDGSKILVNSLTGNADPILHFGLGASTPAGSGNTFGFTFNLPIALSGQINASSSLTTPLTSGSSAGAQIQGIGTNKILTAFDVDTSVLGIGSISKGVDVGDAFGFLGGPQVQNSPVYTASNTFTGNTAYDLMTVKIDFSLSADSSVALTGFVQQVVVPVPAAVWLFASGLLGLAGIARRKA